MIKNIFLFGFLVAAVCWLAGCSGNRKEQQWKVAGTVVGGQGQTLLLEQNQKNNWIPIDSLQIADDGSFSFAVARQAYPDIYRLRLGSESVYFPIDSIETVNIATQAAFFNSKAVVSGTRSAEKMQAINEAVAAAVAQSGVEAAVTDPTLKRYIGQVLDSSWDDMAAYYAINKVVDGRPLFDASRKEDLKIIRAVSNMFATNRPDDPRTPLLTDMSLSALRQYATTPVEIYAEEISVPEIALPDETGEMRSLSDIMKASKVVILDFNDYSQEIYPSYNLTLGEIYKKYQGRGLEIYQVGFDADEFQWAATARNLPWVTVYNNLNNDSQIIGNYNITALPALYVIGSNGEKLVRLSQMDELEPTVTRML